MATSASSLAAVACSSTAPTASAVEGTASTSSVAVAPPLLRSPSAAAGRPPRCGGDLLFRALQGSNSSASQTWQRHLEARPDRQASGGQSCPLVAWSRRYVLSWASPSKVVNQHVPLSRRYILLQNVF
jgi:hypothetical protein